jgi:hypothetical protein
MNNKTAAVGNFQTSAAGTINASDGVYMAAMVISEELTAAQVKRLTLMFQAYLGISA